MLFPFLVFVGISLGRCFQVHLSFTGVKLNYNGYKTISTSLFAETASTLSASQATNNGQIIKADIYDSKLAMLLETMSETEKYDILIQSYGANILESSNKNITELKTMTSLFAEMLQKAIQPSERATKSLLDAASKFGSCDKVGRALQLSKASGLIRAYGVGNGKLITPVTSAKNADFLPEFPKDDREKEILYAGGVATIAASWVALQGLSVFDNDLHNWATLVASGAIAIALADVFARNQVGVKAAIAGFDRLLLKDNMRDADGDSAAFVVGYLLGLPCFCFRPDVTEALKLILDHRSSMEAYQQTALPTGRSPFGSTSVRVDKAPQTEQNMIQSVMSALSSGSFIGLGSGSGSSAGAGRSGAGTGLMLFSQPTADVEYDVFGVGRVLIWLMAPVAIETLKYGKTITSDPKRAGRFLSVLEELLKQRRNSDLQNGSEGETDQQNKQNRPWNRSPKPLLVLPEPGQDREAFLRWAFYEATVMVQQNADLLEAVRGYLQTGTATVGEVALLLEDELRG